MNFDNKDNLRDMLYNLRDNKHKNDCHKDCHNDESPSCFWPIILLFIPVLIFAIIVITVIIIPAPATLNGIQTQLVGDVTNLENEETVIFDDLIMDNSEAISYDDTTGEFSITQSGTYYLDWWVATDGTPLALTVDFALVTPGGDTIITTSSPVMYGQAFGSAVLEVVATDVDPFVFRLINTTGNEIFIAPINVRGNFTIIHVAQ